MREREFEELAESFLLNRLSEVEREAVERRLFEDDRFFESVNAFEKRLLAGYLAGCLEPEDMAAVRARYGSTDPLMGKLEAVARETGESAACTPQGWQRNRVWIAVALCAASIFIGMVLWPQIRRNETRPREARSAVRAPDREERVIAAIALTRAETRSTHETPEVSVPAGPGMVEVLVPMNPRFPASRLNAVLAVPEGQEVWRASLPIPLNGFDAVIRVPADLLKSGDYLLILDDADGGPAHESRQLRVRTE